MALYRFQSRVAADLVMLQSNGQQLLAIIGKSAAASGASNDTSAPKGILLPQEMPPAIAALEAAIAEDEQQRKAQASDSAEGMNDAAQGISLKQRAQPFITMLERCYQADKEIVWGVAL